MSKKDNKKVITFQEAIKDMNEEELERFMKERYEKFIKPMMGMVGKKKDMNRLEN